jgi:hypothetical protein
MTLAGTESALMPRHERSRCEAYAMLPACRINRQMFSILLTELGTISALCFILTFATPHHMSFPRTLVDYLPVDLTPPFTHLSLWLNRHKLESMSTQASH